MSLSCVLLGGFAIGAQVALLWQHNANPSYYKLASTPRYDDIVRTRNVSECSVLALCLVDSVVQRVPASGIDFYVKFICVSIILYADDILLPSIGHCTPEALTRLRN